MESYKCSCYFNGKSKGNAKKLEDDEWLLISIVFEKIVL
jgi:hypothetical protein